MEQKKKLRNTGDSLTGYVLRCSVMSSSLQTPWTIVCQALLSMRFSQQEYWSGVSFSPSGDLPDPGIEPASLMSPALADELFTTSATWEALVRYMLCQFFFHSVGYSFTLLILSFSACQYCLLRVLLSF